MALLQVPETDKITKTQKHHLLPFTGNNKNWVITLSLFNEILLIKYQIHLPLIRVATISL